MKYRENVRHELDRRAKVITHGAHIHLWVSQLQVLEENTVEVVVVVLAGMGQDGVKVGAALVDYGCQADDFRTGANDDK